MWEVIALIVLAAIIFGVTLHEAFWGIVAVGGVACIIFLLAKTTVGKMITLSCMGAVGLLFLWHGTSKLIGIDSDFNKSIASCESKDYSYYIKTEYVPKQQMVLGQTTINYGGYTVADDSLAREALDECLQDARQKKEVAPYYCSGLLVAGVIIVCGVCAHGKKYVPPRRRAK